MLKVGLTGGIAAGKSVVGEMFVALGAAEGKGRILHRSFAHGSLSMAAFAWG